MKLNKLLSLFVCVPVLVCSIRINPAMADTTVETINIVQGASYTLPEKIDDADVTWEGDISTVDTSKVGYQLFNGTMDNDVAVTYRVNIGVPSQMELSDDMSTHETTITGEQTATNTAGTIQNGTFSVAHYDVTKGADATTNNSVQFVLDEGNKVLSIGPESSQWTTKWVPSTPSAGGFVYSMRIKLHSFDTKGKIGDNLFFTNQFGIGATAQDFLMPAVRNDPGNSKVIIKSKNVPLLPGQTNNTDYITDVATMVDSNGIMSSDWFTLEMRAGSTTYDIYVDGVKIAENRGLPAGVAGAGANINQIIWAKRIGIAASNAHTYIDDVKFAPLVYVSGSLPSTAIETKVAQNSTGVQTTALNLTMSNGSTQPFNVQFTPEDTTTIGATGIVTGSIDGFSESVQVSYTVLAASERTVSTTVGATVILADGTTVAPTQIGRLKRTVSTEDEVINYTINVGEYILRLSDAMETHSNGTDPTYGNDTIIPNNSDGLTLAMTNSTEFPNSFTVGGIGSGNQYITVDGATKTTTSNAKWSVVDSFNGDYRVSIKMKIADIAGTITGFGAYVRLYDNAGKKITSAIAPRVMRNADPSKSYVAFRGIKEPNDIADNPAEVRVSDPQYNLNYGIKDGDDAYSTDWFTITIDVHGETGTYDLALNGVTTHTGNEFVSEGATGNIGAISIDCRTDYAITSSFDDLSIYQYNCFTDELPKNEMVLLAKDGANTSQIHLNMSNGGVKDFNITINGIDTSRLGVVATTAKIIGFDETIPVNAKVCNYHLDSFEYMLGNEFKTAPVAGGKISTANVINKSGILGGIAVFVWYNGSQRIKALQVVPLSSESGVVTVDLKLPEEEADILGGSLKVFVMDNLTNITPLDIVTQVP